MELEVEVKKVEEEKEELNEEEPEDYVFERELRRVSEELKKINKLREELREELQELIEERKLSKRECQRILIDDCNEEHRRKRAKFDFNEAKRVSCAKNVLAEGDNFNFVYRGTYGNTQLVIAKVGQFINMKTSSWVAHNALALSRLMSPGLVLDL